MGEVTLTTVLGQYNPLKSLLFSKYEEQIVPL